MHWATSAGADISDAHDQIVLATLALASMLAGGIVLLVKTYSQAKAANNAVNNIGPGEHSLWDQIAFIREDVAELAAAQRDFARRGWATLPEDLGTAASLTQTIRAVQRDVVELRKFIEEHDRWERSVKYHQEDM